MKKMNSNKLILLALLLLCQEVFAVGNKQGGGAAAHKEPKQKIVLMVVNPSSHDPFDTKKLSRDGIYELYNFLKQHTDLRAYLMPLEIKGKISSYLDPKKINFMEGMTIPIENGYHEKKFPEDRRIFYVVGGPLEHHLLHSVWSVVRNYVKGRKKYDVRDLTFNIFTPGVYLFDMYRGSDNNFSQSKLSSREAAKRMWGKMKEIIPNEGFNIGVVYSETKVPLDQLEKLVYADSRTFSVNRKGFDFHVRINFVLPGKTFAQKIVYPFNESPPKIQVKKLKGINQKYSFVRYIASGGFGAVYEIKNKASGARKALRLYGLPRYHSSTDIWSKDRDHRRMIVQANYFKEVQKFSPNIMKATPFMLGVKLIEQPGFWFEKRHPKGNEKGFAANPYRDRKDLERSYYEAQLLELMDGVLSDRFELNGQKVDFANYNWPGSPYANNYLSFVIGHMSYVNGKKFNLSWGDFKYRNVGYLKVEKDTFAGKKVSNYDYWHYQVDGFDIYIPTGKATIKRIDPDDMTFGRATTDYKGHWKESFTRGAKALGISLQKYLERFALPAGVPKSKVLTVPKI